MYNREEAQEKRKEFWTAFGVYMRKHTPLCPRARWLNYKTGVHDIYFRMEADNQLARICIDLQHRDTEIRALFYEQFTELKQVLHGIVGHELIWEPNYFLEVSEKNISRIYTQLLYKNIYKKEDWKEIFEFLEQHLVALDEFWSEFRDIFIELNR